MIIDKAKFEDTVVEFCQTGAEEYTVCLNGSSVFECDSYSVTHQMYMAYKVLVEQKMLGKDFTIEQIVEFKNKHPYLFVEFSYEHVVYVDGIVRKLKNDNYDLMDF